MYECLRASSRVPQVCFRTRTRALHSGNDISPKRYTQYITFYLGSNHCAKFYNKFIPYYEPFIPGIFSGISEGAMIRCKQGKLVIYLWL